MRLVRQDWYLERVVGREGVVLFVRPLQEADLAVFAERQRPPLLKEIDIALPDNQRKHRTLHIQKDALPYALR